MEEYDLIRCVDCSEKVSKEIAGLNRKYYGRTVIRFRCLNCLAADMKVDKDELYSKIEYFRSVGCNLFD